jgi:transposase-like protein
MNELKNRGVHDILLTAVDGLTGFPEAIAAVFPKPKCNCAWSTWFATRCGSSHTKTVRRIAGLKTIYLAPSAELAVEALDEFASV